MVERDTCHSPLLMAMHTWHTPAHTFHTHKEINSALSSHDILPLSEGLNDQVLITQSYKTMIRQWSDFSSITAREKP